MVEKRLREHFWKRGPIYIRCCNWFVESEEKGVVGNVME
jgi:hypothetical protein